MTRGVDLLTIEGSAGVEGLQGEDLGGGESEEGDDDEKE